MVLCGFELEGDAYRFALRPSVGKDTSWSPESAERGFRTLPSKHQVLGQRSHHACFDMTKKPLILVAALLLVAAVFCTHIDQDTGAWSFGLPWQGLDTAKQNEALQRLLVDEGATEVIEKVAALVEAGAQLDAPNPGGYLPIHLAIFGGHHGAMQWLLDHGCPIDSRTSNGVQALHEAASHGQLEIVKLLLDNGANVNAVNVSGTQPLHFAAMGGNQQVVALLLKAGASASNKNEDGRSPYDYTDDPEVRNLLVVAGASRSAPSLFEATKLGKQLSRLWLTSDGLEDMDRLAKQLLADGAKPDVVDGEGQQAIHFMTHSAAIMGLLIEKGASVSARNAEGQQPLLLAVSNGHLETVRLLMAKGADPKAKDHHGMTAVELAETDEVRALLQKN